MSEISEILDSWFNRKKFSQKRKDFQAFHNWKDIVGETIANNTKPSKFYKDTLVINVKNSVWTQELQFLKPELLDKIKKSFPNTKIKDLMFKVAPIK